MSFDRKKHDKLFLYDFYKKIMMVMHLSFVHRAGYGLVFPSSLS